MPRIQIGAKKVRFTVSDSEESNPDNSNQDLSD